MGSEVVEKQNAVPDDETGEATPEKAWDLDNDQCERWVSSMSRRALQDFVRMLMMSDAIDQHALRGQLSRFLDDRMAGDAEEQQRPVVFQMADNAKRFAREEGARRLPTAMKELLALARIFDRIDLGKAAQLIGDPTTDGEERARLAAEAHLTLG